MKRNSSNQDYTNNADGFDLSGGTTARKLTVSGADISIVGSGTNTYTFPDHTSTLQAVGDDITTDAILENTPDNGVTIDGLSIKDGLIAQTGLPANAITLGYAERTSDFSSTTVGSYVDVTDLSITISVPDVGRKLKLTAYSRFPNGNGVFSVAIREGSNNITYATSVVASTGNQVVIGVINPSAGTHTYKVSISQSTSGTMIYRGTSGAASFILAELI